MVLLEIGKEIGVIGGKLQGFITKTTYIPIPVKERSFKAL
jgi:hypothetical protein